MSGVILEALEWKKWKDWERALVFWKECGRDGISLSGLAELTGRSEREITEEIKARDTVGGCWCEALEAPVFLVRYHRVNAWDKTLPGYKKIEWLHRHFYMPTKAGYMTYGSNNPKEFWAKVKEVKAPTKWKTNAKRMAELKAATAGKRSPWRSAVKGTFGKKG